MKLVHSQTQFAQVDVEVHHDISWHGRSEHLLLMEGDKQQGEEWVTRAAQDSSVKLHATSADTYTTEPMTCGHPDIDS